MNTQTPYVLLQQKDRDRKETIKFNIKERDLQQRTLACNTAKTAESESQKIKVRTSLTLTASVRKSKIYRKLLNRSLQNKLTFEEFNSLKEQIGMMSKTEDTPPLIQSIWEQQEKQKRHYASLWDQSQSISVQVNEIKIEGVKRKDTEAKVRNTERLDRHFDLHFECLENTFVKDLSLEVKGMNRMHRERERKTEKSKEAKGLGRLGAKISAKLAPQLLKLSIHKPWRNSVHLRQKSLTLPPSTPIVDIAALTMAIPAPQSHFLDRWRFKQQQVSPEAGRDMSVCRNNLNVFSLNLQILERNVFGDKELPTPMTSQARRRLQGTGLSTSYQRKKRFDRFPGVNRQISQIDGWLVRNEEEGDTHTFN